MWLPTSKLTLGAGAIGGIVGGSVALSRYPSDSTLSPKQLTQGEAWNNDIDLSKQCAILSKDDSPELKDQKFYVCLGENQQSQNPRIFYSYSSSESTLNNSKNLWKVKNIYWTDEDKGNLRFQVVNRDNSIDTYFALRWPSWLKNISSTRKITQPLIPENHCTLTAKSEGSSEGKYTFSCSSPWEIINGFQEVKIP